MSPTPLVLQCLTEVQRVFREAKKTGKREDARLRYRELTENMLLSVARMNDDERDRLMSGITREESGLLFGIAMSAAVWAVRESAPERLRFGVLALLVENKTEDFRETLMHLCLLNHSAEKLGVNLEPVYREVRPVASPETAELLDSYFREGERNISAMGYEEIMEKDGFGYRRTW